MLQGSVWVGRSRQGENTSATVSQKVNQHVFCVKLEEVEVCCFQQGLAFLICGPVQRLNNLCTPDMIVTIISALDYALLGLRNVSAPSPNPGHLQLMCGAPSP